MSNEVGANIFPPVEDYNTHIDNIHDECSDDLVASGRSGASDSIPETEQNVPVWSAYNSKILQCVSPQPPDQVFPLPLINAAPHEWPTLVTTLAQLCKLNDVSCHDKMPTVTSDMDLYKKVLKLPYLDSKYANRWILSPGALHIELCAWNIVWFR